LVDDSLFPTYIHGMHMLTTFVLAFGIFVAAVVAMALGVVLSGRRIEGSCGGLNRLAGVESDCGGACRRPCERRRKAMKEAAGEAA
jgi:hypothetical protein